MAAELGLEAVGPEDGGLWSSLAAACVLPRQYVATSSSHLCLAVEGQITLCTHKQSGPKAKRLRTPYVTGTASFWL